MKLKYIQYRIEHFCEGFLTILISFFINTIYQAYGIALLFIFVSLFVIYEYVEYAIKHDKAYLDILYYAIGLGAGSIYIILLYLSLYFFR